MTNRHLSKWICALVVLGLIGLVPIVAACTDGHTPGFWSNKNGQALIGTDDLAMLQALNLKDANGNDFDPATKEEFRAWLLGGTATNMAYMLSVQLAAMRLNVLNGFVTTDHYVLAPGVNDADDIVRLGALLVKADRALAWDGTTPAQDGDIDRDFQEAVKDALDNANNNLNWVD